MTKEQFNKAVEIDKKIDQLSNILEILNLAPHKLGYVFGQHGEYSCNRCVNIDAIAEILYRHDKQIRDEILKEIEQLEKEIELL